MAHQLSALREENRRLRSLLARCKCGVEENKTCEREEPKSACKQSSDVAPPFSGWSALPADQVARYGRHMILPAIGAEGQKRICSASVLVVGAGGLGAPVCLYLAGAGIGHLGIVDHDSVELSNIHRQIIHTEERVGSLKAKSAAIACSSVNSSIKITAYPTRLTRENALSLISAFDVTVDCTDNLATRYLLNDAAVLAQRPLVSGAALRTDGQVTVYYFKGGPCLRCVFPEPPPADTVSSCSDSGVLGVLPGIIGTLQALETLKVVLDLPLRNVLAQRMLVLDGISTRIMVVKLRPRNVNCVVCGDSPSLTKLPDYAAFCGCKAVASADGVCSASCEEYADFVRTKAPHVLVDVREEVQFNICHFPHALHIPISSLAADPAAAVQTIRQKCKGSDVPVYVVCRRGVKSLRATRLLQEAGLKATDVRGGFEAWKASVDPAFPVY